MDLHYDDAIAKSGGMPRAAQHAIDFVLHPDTRRNATEADKDEVLQAVERLENVNEKARRQAR
jgi:hypothetical protein